ncbi:hypothetical protein D6D15_10589, partial [Aureobasidium pullulans]
GQDIAPSEHLKLLGVTLNRRQLKLQGSALPLGDYEEFGRNKATALIVAQAEAGIENTDSRLQRKVVNHLVRSLTVLNTNPLFECLIRLFT